MGPAKIPGGILWIVATPIGTLEDLAPRARRILDEVDLILAEDTRRTRRLLSHFEVASRGRLTSLHEHNESRRVESVLERLQNGEGVALVSDAGTPVLSDPGFELVRAVRDAGLQVASVPGPSSFTAALAAAGQPPLPAVLVGFLPPRAGARRRRIAELAVVPWTLVVLLSPHRIEREIADLANGLGGGRPATLLAELSKAHERAESATLAELAVGDEVRSPRGEYVLVVGPEPGGGAPGTCADPEAAQKAYRDALSEDLSRADALRAAARRLGVSRRVLYDLLEKDENS